MQNNIITVEQKIPLKDGRTIYKTHNGFKSFVIDKKGITTEVTNEYYNKVKLNSVSKLSPKLVKKRP